MRSSIEQTGCATALDGEEEAADEEADEVTTPDALRIVLPWSKYNWRLTLHYEILAHFSEMPVQRFACARYGRDVA